MSSKFMTACWYWTSPRETCFLWHWLRPGCLVLSSVCWLLQGSTTLLMMTKRFIVFPLSSFACVCCSSSSERPADRLPGSHNPSVYMHAALRKGQENASPNTTQTQATKLVRATRGAWQMPARAWSPPSCLLFSPHPGCVPSRARHLWLVGMRWCFALCGS